MFFFSTFVAFGSTFKTGGSTKSRAARFVLNKCQRSTENYAMPKNKVTTEKVRVCTQIKIKKASGEKSDTVLPGAV